MSNGLNLEINKNIGSCVPCRALGEEASFGIGRLPFKEGPGVLVTDVRAVSFQVITPP